MRYTLNRYGESQVQKYTHDLTRCAEDLINATSWIKTIDVQQHKVRVIKCQKHYIFALVRHDSSVLVIAILHKRMDMVTRLKSRLS